MTDNNHHQDSHIRDFLNDYSAGLAPLDTLLAYYGLAYEDVADLVFLVDELGSILAEVAPSEAFVAQLYDNLLAQRRYFLRAWWLRMQDMPPRMKLAAGIGGITLTAGFLFMTMRSLNNLLPPFLQRQGEDDDQPVVEIVA